MVDIRGSGGRGSRSGRLALDQGTASRGDSALREQKRMCLHMQPVSCVSACEAGCQFLSMRPFFDKYHAPFMLPRLQKVVFSGLQQQNIRAFPLKLMAGHDLIGFMATFTSGMIVFYNM